MGFKFNQEFRYRMPTVFGPAVGPRQKPGGGMWALEETGTMNAEWMAITYRTSADKLEALLPPVACCRFHGHRVKVFLLKLESMNAKTNIQPRV
ncbi:hypothetical protein ACQZ4Z_19480 [Agrobacterium vitis]